MYNISEDLIYYRDHMIKQGIALKLLVILRDRQNHPETVEILIALLSNIVRQSKESATS